jgi:hypothetical protein
MLEGIMKLPHWTSDRTKYRSACKRVRYTRYACAPQWIPDEEPFVLLPYQQSHGVQPWNTGIGPIRMVPVMWRQP